MEENIDLKKKHNIKSNVTFSPGNYNLLYERIAHINT